jgi:hypothetical protein
MFFLIRFYRRRCQEKNIVFVYPSWLPKNNALLVKVVSGVGSWVTGTSQRRAFEYESILADDDDAELGLGDFNFEEELNEMERVDWHDVSGGTTGALTTEGTNFRDIKLRRLVPDSGRSPSTAPHSPSTAQSPEEDNPESLLKW